MSTCLQHTFLHLLFATFQLLWGIGTYPKTEYGQMQLMLIDPSMSQPTGPHLCHRQRRILPWRQVSAWRGPRAAGPPPPWKDLILWGCRGWRCLGKKSLDLKHRKKKSLENLKYPSQSLTRKTHNTVAEGISLQNDGSRTLKSVNFPNPLPILMWYVSSNSVQSRKLFKLAPL